MTENLKHFVELARRGKHPGASSGEKRCYALAKAVLESLYGVDERAVQGLLEFCDITANAWHEGDTLLNG